MGSEPRQGPLPLAEAILAWSEPHLIDAIRAAEAQFHPDEWARLDRDPLDKITDRRMQPRRGRTINLAGPDPRLRPLDRAWEAVLNALRLKVERGEICLTGRMIRPDMRAEADPIPSVWATELHFDVRGAAIFIRDQVYAAVTAAMPSRDKRLVGTVREGAAGPSGEDAPASREADRLTLLQAIVRWSDAKLVARVQDEERKLIAYELHQYPMPKLLDESEWRQPTSRSWMVPTDYVFLTAAWNDLIIDFRTRLVRGEFHLRGVMAQPHRARTEDVLPGVWAADYRFDFLHDAVSLDGARYIAVRAAYGAAPEVDLTQGDAEVPPGRNAPEEGGRSGDEGLTGGATAIGIYPTSPAPLQHAIRAGGREPAPPLIEEALRVHWDDLFPAGAPSRPESWVQLANSLSKRVKRAKPSLGGVFPKEETVRKHLPKIYAQLLDEKARTRASDQ